MAPDRAYWSPNTLYRAGFVLDLNVTTSVATQEFCPFEPIVQPAELIDCQSCLPARHALN